MKINDTCDWKAVASHYDFLVDMYSMATDLLMDRYSTHCSTHKPWFMRLSLLDYSLFFVFTSFLAIFYTKGRVFIYSKLSKSFDCNEGNLKRAAQVTCQFIVRCLSMIWTSVVIFYLPSCSVLKNPSSSWQFLDAKEHPLRMTPVYCFAASMYLWHLISITFIDEKRKDFRILLVHHIVTLLAILISYTIKFYDMGLLIYFLHDFNDPFLEVGKVIHYLKVDKNGYLNRTYSIAGDIVFAMFALSWIPTRLYLYPLRGINALIAVPRDSCDFITIAFGTFLLFILYVLNFLWFIMLSKAVVNRIISGGFTDETMDDPDKNKISTQQNMKRRKSSGFTSDFIDQLDQLSNQGTRKDE